MIELVLFGKLRLQRLGPTPGPRLHLRQTVIALRPHHQIDHGLTADNLFAFGLRHTARHTDLEIRFRSLQPLEPAKLGIHFLRRLFANMAGVQKDHIGVLRRRRLNITLRAKAFGHAFAVIDIHLTPVGLDEELFRLAHGIPALSNMARCPTLHRPPSQRLQIPPRS